MKMTMHIDSELLQRVIKAYGFKSKTEAVDAALQEMDRQVRYREFVDEPCPFTPEQLANAAAPDYDPLAIRVAESVAPYGSEDG